MKISFAKDAWSMDDFEQVTSLRTDGRIPFMQLEDCVVNDVQKEEIMSHNYISLLSRRVFGAPLRLSTKCSFDKFGAPLLVLTDDVKPTEDGYPAYGHHFEIVAYENGINVWELNGTAKPIRSGFLEFFVPAGEAFVLEAKVEKQKITVQMCGQTLSLELPTLPEKLRCGITACEGVNRFYSFEAEEY